MFLLPAQNGMLSSSPAGVGSGCAASRAGGAAERPPRLAGRAGASSDGAAPAIGDADRVLQVISNLVENALRMTPRGGEVRVVTAPGLLRVEDTGPGLRPDEHAHAFERFYLHERYGHERTVGTGLGLAIVKELTEAMGGVVEVASQPGRPTTFTVRFAVPLAEPAGVTVT